MSRALFAWVTCAAFSLFGEELRNGTFFPLEKVPAELIARAPAGTSVRFVLEENGTTGYRWEIDSNTNECEVVAEHRGVAENGLAGAPGKMSVTVTSKVQTPARAEFRYRRPWEKDVKPVKSVRFILYTAADKVASPLYPDNAVNRLLKKECEKRGIVITDWHLHIRGGMTPEMAVEREKASGILSSAMENHGREWEIFDTARLADFAARARKANPTYLPDPLAADYDRLWTEDRMRQLIAKAVKCGIALEIQAESSYPRPKFLKLAKEMGAKFSFGTNNFDPTPKDLSRWLEAIVWLDLSVSDVWTPADLKPGN